MFNVSQFYKKLSEAKAKHDKTVREARSHTLFQKKRDKLAENYKKRVDQFVIEMAYEPVIIKEYVKPMECSGRPQPDPSKFKGGAIMIMKGYRTEKDRLKDAQAVNSYLDSDGANFKKLNLRARDQSKEINPKMRFKANSTVERVMDVVNAQHGISWNPIKKGMQGKQKSTNSSQGTGNQEQIGGQSPKNLLDSLNSLQKKTHFKAVQSISLGGQHKSLSASPIQSPQNFTQVKKETTPSIQQTGSSQLSQNKQQQNQPETQTNTKQRMDMTVPLTQEEIIRHATQVLQDCNVQSVRKLPPLQKGYGRLSGTSQYTNREIYQITSHFKSAQSSRMVNFL